MTRWRDGEMVKRWVASAFLAAENMTASYSGRWDLVQLRWANFMSCTLEERVALILLELIENVGFPTGKGCG